MRRNAGSHWCLRVWGVSIEATRACECPEDRSGRRVFIVNSLEERIDIFVGDEPNVVAEFLFLAGINDRFLYERVGVL